MTDSQHEELVGRKRHWRRGEPAAGGRLAFRHRLSTRVWHWLNALAVFAMLMSGLMIFNAHPRLYWGEYGANHDAAVLEIGSAESWVSFALRACVSRPPACSVTGRMRMARYNAGFSRLGNHSFHLRPGHGRAAGISFLPGRCADPGIPICCGAAATGTSSSDLAPSREQLRPGHLWQDIDEHARLRFPTGDAALRYNITAKTRLSVPAVHPVAADCPDRPHDVPGHECRLAVAARCVRRPPVGARHAFYRGDLH